MAAPQQSSSRLEHLFLQICRSGEITTAALARAVRLATSTLESKLRVLERKGLVRFARRKVGLNPGFGHVVGIDMGASHLHFALGDFRGEIVNDSTLKIRPEDGPWKMIAQIKEGIRHLAGDKPGGRLRGLAIGVPSPVVEGGVVAFANNLVGWKNINLGEELRKEFRVPVFMENDANMAAIGEHWRGVARGVDNFVFIALGTGIGSGVFVNGELYRGRTGSAGELFRLNVDWQRWNEEFPDTGHFESYVSGQGIAAEGHKALGPGEGGGAAGLAEERDAFFVFQAHRQGNPQATAVLERIFTMLGVGMADVVAILDPDLIVFGGGIARGDPDLMISIVEKVVRRIQKEITPPFRLSSLGDKAQTYGAISSALSMAQRDVARRLR